MKTSVPHRHVVIFASLLVLAAGVLLYRSRHKDVGYQIAVIERQPNVKYKLNAARRVLNRLGSDELYQAISTRDGELREGEIYISIVAFRQGDSRFRPIVVEAATNGWVLARDA